VPSATRRASKKVAEMELVGVYFDTERRLPVELPQNVREIAESMRVTRETPIALAAGPVSGEYPDALWHRQITRLPL